MRPDGGVDVKYSPHPPRADSIAEREGGRLFRIWSNGPDAEPDTDDDICYEPLDEAER